MQSVSHEVCLPNTTYVFKIQRRLHNEESSRCPPPSKRRRASSVSGVVAGTYLKDLVSVSKRSRARHPVDTNIPHPLIFQLVNVIDGTSGDVPACRPHISRARSSDLQNTIRNLIRDHRKRLLFCGDRLISCVYLLIFRPQAPHDA